MKYSVLAILLLSPIAASAQERASAPADPGTQALTYELQECVGNKIRTTTQFFALKAQLDAANKRADEAESKLKASENPQPK